jgi:hypothetical protein
MMLRILSILIVFQASAALAQRMEYVRPIHSLAEILSIRQEQNLERTLGELFPSHILHKATIQDRWDLLIAERSIPKSESSKLTGKRIVYDILKQHGKKYAVVIFSGSWKSDASQLVIFRIEAGGYPSAVYHSKCWRSNFSDSYHEIHSISLGKENVIIIKEGENGKSPFVIASLFSFNEKKSNEATKGYFWINDLTPHLPRLNAIVNFPMKALYCQSIKLEKMSDHLRLQAADVEFSWNQEPKGIAFWNLAKSSRKFIAENNDSIPVVDGR